jgi:glyoxylase-like metal-dependent hydrolase (beta-lactamase superfamily II)
MTHYICITCGTQYSETEGAPARCVICEEERQYVNAKGQMWTTLSELRATHHNRIVAEEPGLTGIGSEPSFAIGQRALLVQAQGGPAPHGSSAVPAPQRGAAQGGVLWDCISLVDDATVETVRELGGIRAIAISHPHFYSAMAEWSRAFGRVPIYLHAADRQWVMRPDAAIHFWDGETFDLGDGLTLIRCGGHFAGSTALHWAAGAEGHGALLTSDTLTVVSDRRYLSFLYSYPNLIPLPAAAVQQIARSVEPFAFDRIYGGWFERVVPTDAKGVVARSAERYVKAVSR